MNNNQRILISVISFILCAVIGFLCTGLINGSFSMPQMRQGGRTDVSVSKEINNIGSGAAITQNTIPSGRDVVVEHTQAPAVSNEKVVLEDIDIKTEEAPTAEPEIYKVKKISEEELAEVLNSGSSDMAIAHDFKSRVTPGCRFSFSGLDEEIDAEVPRSYNDIIMRISMGTWSRVRIVSVSYDEHDMLRGASINIEH